MTARPQIKLSFLGGAGEIGASSALIQVADTSLLIDCGVRFRKGQALPDLDHLTGRKLDAILVTHAHSDHTGALPVIHEAFPATPIHLTPPTADLVTILQRDALKIMHAADREDDVPLYSERQVESMVEVLRRVEHDRSFTVGEVVVTYLPASHILGASMIHMATPGGHVLFTGDYCVTAQRSVPGLVRPSLPVDLIVTESTYGNRMHADRRVAEARLVQTIAEVTEAGGRVLIPAFAIGRAQEVLLILKAAIQRKQMPDVPVFVDGMVRAVCGVYGQHERYVTPALARDIRTAGHPFFAGKIQAVASPRDRKHVLDAGACVIVSSSGMLHGGPSAFYAGELAGHEKDAILITGYQDEESPGSALLKLASGSGPRQLRLGDRVVDVRCRFSSYSLSAHADRMQMVGLVEALQPSTVVLVHGDPAAKTAMAASLGADDIVLANDGDQITRAYKVRAVTPRRTTILAGRTAAALIGPDTGSPLQISALADAWLGRAARPEESVRVADALVEARVARRDPEDPNCLWSLVPGPRRADATDEHEVRLLKADNPKGRLLELCMRRRLTPPELTHEEDGEVHTVEMRLATPSGALASGIVCSSSRTLAEQMAARALLELLRSKDPSAEVVAEADEARLKQDNPKGRLIELTARRKLGPPVFKVEADVDGFIGWCELQFPDEAALASRRYAARQAKTVEQAAAAELLLALLARGAAELPTAAEPPSVPSPASTPPRDARGQLNEMRQLGLIHAYAFELVERRGPAHMPVFVVRGRVEINLGETLYSGSVEARSKKEGEVAVSGPLLEIVLDRSRIQPGRASEGRG